MCDLMYKSDGIKAMSLTVDDIMHLERSTKYKEEDIRRWFRSDLQNLKLWPYIPYTFYSLLIVTSKALALNHPLCYIHICSKIEISMEGQQASTQAQ